MALFGRGTTPYLTIIVEGRDLTSAHVYVIVRQREKTLTKDGADVSCTYNSQEDTSELGVSYTQQDTLSLADGDAQVQLRWIYADGTAEESEIAKVTIGRVIKGGVITYA